MHKKDRTSMKQALKALAIGGMMFAAGSKEAMAAATINDNTYKNLNDALNAAGNDSVITLTDDDSSVNNFEFTGNSLSLTSSDNLVKSINNAYSVNNGGVLNLKNDSALVLKDINFDKNTTELSGGALYTEKALSITAQNSSFTNNHSEEYGGAIHTDGLIIDGDNITFAQNSSFMYGGAIYNGNRNYNDSAKSLHIAGNNVSFIENSAEQGLGGAVYSNGDTSLSGSNMSFTNNFAEYHGGALAVDNFKTFTISGNNIRFVGNSTNYGVGGAIFSRSGLTISGNDLFFYNNMGNNPMLAEKTPNSIYFELADFGNFDITTNGNLFMYDPFMSSASNSLTINKTGEGVWLLGGQTITQNAQWNIQKGTLLLTRDSMDNTAAIFSNAYNYTFELGSAATLLVVPDMDSNTAVIDFSVNPDPENISLQGQVGVGSDFRYTPQIQLGEKTLLQLVGDVHNEKRLVSTAGVFGLGLYDYNYSNLHWENAGQDLKLNVDSSYVNPDRSGGYSVQAPIAILLSNNTNQQIFGRINANFDKSCNDETDDKISTLACEEDKYQALWGSSYYTHAKTNNQGIYKDASIKGSGLILGTDFSLGKNSFLGFAVSGDWPKYNQGQTKIKNQGS